MRTITIVGVFGYLALAGAAVTATYAALGWGPMLAVSAVLTAALIVAGRLWRWAEDISRRRQARNARILREREARSS